MSEMVKFNLLDIFEKIYLDSRFSTLLKAHVIFHCYALTFFGIKIESNLRKLGNLTGDILSLST